MKFPGSSFLMPRLFRMCGLFLKCVGEFLIIFLLWISSLVVGRLAFLFPSVTSCVFLNQSSLPPGRKVGATKGPSWPPCPPPLGVSWHWELPLCWPQPNTQSQRGPPVTALPHFQVLVLSPHFTPICPQWSQWYTPGLSEKKKNPEVPGEQLQVASPGVQMPWTGTQRNRTPRWVIRLCKETQKRTGEALRPGALDLGTRVAATGSTGNSVSAA